MVTFRDLKIGDSIYEANIESKKIWIDKIEDITASEFFLQKFKCIDQDGLSVHLDVSLEDLNKSICEYGSIYSTNINLLLKAICDS